MIALIMVEWTETLSKNDVEMDNQMGVDTILALTRWINPIERSFR
jgi:hypothetical protein